jgi:hypothetical protein
MIVPVRLLMTMMVAVPAVGVGWNEGIGLPCRHGVGQLFLMMMNEVDQKGL